LGYLKIEISYCIYFVLGLWEIDPPRLSAAAPEDAQNVVSAMDGGGR